MESWNCGRSLIKAGQSRRWQVEDMRSEIQKIDNDQRERETKTSWTHSEWNTTNWN